VDVHHGNEAKIQERWQEQKITPLLDAPNVEVVLRHFHRCCYRGSPLWFFCWKGL
jgi:hypothetical protein